MVHISQLIILAVLTTIVVIVILSLTKTQEKTLSNVGGSCTTNADCLSERCHEGTCRECVFESDCADGFTCEDYTCQELSFPPVIPPEPTCDPTCSLTEITNEFDISSVATYMRTGVFQPGTGEKLLLGDINYLYRFNADGTLDTTFGTAGSTYLSAGGFYMNPVEIKFDTIGNIIVLGSSNKNGFSGALMRLSSNGVIDAGFGASGMTAGGQSNSYPYSFQIAADGSFYVANGTENGSISKYTSAGLPDGGFSFVGTNGTGTLGPQFLYPIASDGSCMAVGIFHHPASSIDNVGIGKWLSTGAIDTTFGTNGFIWQEATSWPFNTTTCNYVYMGGGRLAPDGSMFVGGAFNADLSGGSSCSYYPFFLFKFAPDGSIDTTFGTNGLYYPPDEMTNDWVDFERGTMLFNPCDDSIILARYHQPNGTDSRTVISKLSATGVLDPNFTTFTTPNFNSLFVFIRRESDGKIFGFGWEDGGDSKYSTAYACEMTSL
jgi:uncharacterized delta-60 repeat protein